MQKKSAANVVLGPDRNPVVPFDTEIVGVEFMQPSEVLNLGYLNKVAHTQAIITEGERLGVRGVYVYSAVTQYPFADFYPFSALKKVRYKKVSDAE